MQPLFQWKRNVLHILNVYVCSLKYPACTALAPYYVVFCGLPGSTVSSHILINGTIFKIKKLLNLKRVFWFSLQILSQIFLIVRRTECDIIKKIYISLHVKCPLFVSDFNETWIFATDFRKNTQISNFIKIRQVRVELLHADWRTDRQTWRS